MIGNQSRCYPIKMASGGAQYKDYEGKNVEQNKPRSNRKPPRSYSSFNGDLSLHAELQRNEHEDYDSLPNNLVCNTKFSWVDVICIYFKS